MKKITFQILLISLALPNLWAQTRHYVKNTATGQNIGTSWADAFTDLHSALNTVQAGDEIWVAEGLFLPDTGTNRDRSFVLKSGVKLIGGFSGTETTLAQRDFTIHPTILSGNIGNPDIAEDNSYTVLYMAYPDTSTLLDGLLLQDGYAQSDTAFNQISPVRSGGAVYVMAQNGKGQPTFRNCIFQNNYARDYGGAYFVNAQGSSGSTPLFNRCTFRHNTAGFRGGAIYVTGGNYYDRGIEYDHCVFESNTTSGDFGGGIYWRCNFGSEQWDFVGCYAEENASKVNGGFLYYIYFGTNPLKLQIDSCRFERNSKKTYATIHSEPIPSGEQCIIKIRNTDFIDDQSYFGPLDISNMSNTSLAIDTFLIQNCTFIRPLGTNVAFYGTGWLGRGFIYINNNIIWKVSYESLPTPNDIGLSFFSTEVNIKDNFIYYPGPSVGIGLVKRPLFPSYANISGNLFLNNAGSMIFENINSAVLSNSSITLTGNTFAKCKDSSEEPSNKYSSINATNNIFYNCKSATTGLPALPFRMNQDTFFFSHNYFDSDYFCTGYPNITCGPNNIFGIDPMFRDTAAGDYRLSGCSPLINMGFNGAAAGLLTDLAGLPRIQDGQVDIGAYEVPPFGLAAAAVVHPACAGASDGSILLEPDNGCAPYSYQWEPQAGNGPELNDLPPGQYQITLSDASGRQLTDTLTVPEAPLPVASIQATDVLCGLLSGGQLSASVQSGTAPFSWYWQPAAPDTSALSQLPPGDYALAITDANGCVDDATASIGLAGQITLLVGGSPISCHAAADAWLSATPVTGAAPFSWQWLGWPGTDSLAQPLGPGLYAVTVSDKYGCTAAFSYPPLTEPDSLWIGTGVSHQTQSNPPNGAAVVTTITGGTGPFTYLWSNGVTQQATAGLVSGFYTVTVTDNRGCTVSTTVEVKFYTSTSEVGAIALHVYPNPAGEWVQVQLPDQVQATSLELLNPQGRLVRHWPGQERRLDLSGIPAGAYTLLVHARDGGVLRAGVVKR